MFRRGPVCPRPPCSEHARSPDRAIHCPPGRDHGNQRPEDIPGPNQISYFRDPCPILAPSSVHYLGEPVLLLVGEDMTLLRRLADQVRVRYEEVPAIHTMEEALAGGRPPIFGPDNVYEDETFGHGDVDQIFTQAVEIFETTTRTGYQDHLYLEP